MASDLPLAPDIFLQRYDATAYHGPAMGFHPAVPAAARLHWTTAR
jgi:hypothetical protein